MNLDHPGDPDYGPAGVVKCIIAERGLKSGENDPKVTHKCRSLRRSRLMMAPPGHRSMGNQ